MFWHGWRFVNGNASINRTGAAFAALGTWHAGRIVVCVNNLQGMHQSQTPPVFMTVSCGPQTVAHICHMAPFRIPYARQNPYTYPLYAI